MDLLSQVCVGLIGTTGNFAEAATNTCMIEERSANTIRLLSLVLMRWSRCSGIIVEKLCEYLSYKALYQSSPPKEIPEFQERLQPEIALDLYVYLPSLSHP